jgi:hypothetical protein
MLGREQGAELSKLKSAQFVSSWRASRGLGPALWLAVTSVEGEILNAELDVMTTRFRSLCQEDDGKTPMLLKSLQNIGSVHNCWNAIAWVKFPWW